MINFIKKIISTLILLIATSCASGGISKEIDLEGYLLEAKNCIHTESSNSNEVMDITSQLKDHLERLQLEDYISHTFFEDDEIAIDFRKRVKDESFIFINLYIDLNKDNGCGRISVYQTVNDE